MSDIIVPEEPNKINYVATEDDEEKFFLMYHLNFQPSECDNLDRERRRWIIARFLGQKKHEQEIIQRQKLMNDIGPNLRVHRP